MKERIQKILSARGVCSRRKAEEWIADGRVQCNGIVCGLGDTADPDTDSLLLDGKPLPAPAGNVYILLNKPRGYVTTLSDEMGRKCAADLVTDCGVRVYPVGRLDMDSEGLLLFTNDGISSVSILNKSSSVTGASNDISSPKRIASGSIPMRKASLLSVHRYCLYSAGTSNHHFFVS